MRKQIFIKMNEKANVSNVKKRILPQKGCIISFPSFSSPFDKESSFR